jgi:hypothetical protein
MFDVRRIAGKVNPRTAKSWLACVVGHKACRDNQSVTYIRSSAQPHWMSAISTPRRLAFRLSVCR